MGGGCPEVSCSCDTGIKVLILCAQGSPPFSYGDLVYYANHFTNSAQMSLIKHEGGIGVVN